MANVIKLGDYLRKQFNPAYDIPSDRLKRNGENYNNQSEGILNFDPKNFYIKKTDGSYMIRKSLMSLSQQDNSNQKYQNYR